MPRGRWLLVIRTPRQVRQDQLSEFLAKLPVWVRKAITDDFDSMSAEELKDFSAYMKKHGGSPLLDLNQEYQRLARQIPREWRKYCEIQQRNALQNANIPWPSVGRPRSALITEAKLLKAKGKSYQQIANLLNANYGSGTTNREAIRKLLSRIRKRSTPDKIQP